MVIPYLRRVSSLLFEGRRICRFYHRLLGEGFKPAISPKPEVSLKSAVSLKPKRSLENGLAGSGSRSSAGSTSSGARGSRLDAVEVSALKRVGVAVG